MNKCFNSEVRIICEDCEHGVTCKKLGGCKEFAYTASSNFLKEVEVKARKSVDVDSLTAAFIGY